MKSRKLFLIPFLFIFLCGMSTKNAADYTGEKISKASIVTEEYDLMNFPAVPCSYSVNEMGKVAVGFKQAGKTYFLIIEDGTIEQIYYYAEMEGDFQIELHEDVLIIYAARADYDVCLNLNTCQIQRGSLSRSDNIAQFDKLKTQQVARSGTYELVSDVVDGHFSLQLNGKTILQCSALVTHLKMILSIFVAFSMIVGCVYFIYKHIINGMPKVS